ncbi:hypothetical protein Pmani_036173 [Petrolisthes manimaculis]|uniref:Ubiquitin-like protein NEDD8 n=1 Tax=Petrolisthes manimaculis TaxID=1843537 RepID=A0AAE1NIY1_9EUCA|nr:hypothetical protein Pmani_036173 [Petrolisthes manimaculis]
MLIKVKTLTGKEIEIDIEPTDKVERIKERVEEKEGIPPPQQRLIFSGKQMNDEKTAADYKVQGGSVLHLVLALRGGYHPCPPHQPDDCHLKRRTVSMSISCYSVSGSTSVSVFYSQQRPDPSHSRVLHLDSS